MSPEQESLKRAILDFSLQLDAELPDSPIAQLVAFRTRRLFEHELSNDGTFSAVAWHEVGLLMAVMREQIELIDGESTA